jgi:ribosomal protein L13
MADKKDKKTFDVDTELKEIEKQMSGLNMLNDLLSYSMPRQLGYTTNVKLELTARDVEYMQRHEMYRDKFTRLMVSLIIKNAIGASVTNNIPFQIKLDKDVELPKNIEELLKEEFDYLEKLIAKDLNTVILDSQFYGDGYVYKHIEDKKGITKLINNYSTKAFNITPIVTNKANTIAYEVSNDSSKAIFSNTSKFTNIGNASGRRYVVPFIVGRINAKKTIEEPTLEQFAHIDNMNVFLEDELPYEDNVHGGVVEGAYEDFINFRWAIKALANTRVASSIVERFIIHNLGDLAKDEKDTLKKALEKVLKDQIDAVKERQKNKNPDVLISNHIIPTTGDNATNSVSIQESNPSFAGFQNIDDIMLHIKKFLGSLGFTIELTPFGSGSVGGMERDGQIQNSLSLEESADNIREATADYIKDIVKTHLIAKHNMNIDENILKVEFTSVINHSKVVAEQQRVEHITNTQQLLGIIDQLKAQGWEDTEENRKVVESTIYSMLPQDEDEREEIAKVYTNIVFTKPKENQEEEI